MDELNTSGSVFAEGGKVWAVPSDTGAPSVGSGTRPSRWLSQTLRATITLLVMVSPFMFVVLWVLGSISEMREKLDMRQGLAEEYGYMRVVVDEEASFAEVVTLEGEEKKVDVIDYKGYMVLFESVDQLEEKMAEVDTGTYPEELHYSK